MIIIFNSSDKAKLENIDPQTIITYVDDVIPPSGSYIVNMNMDSKLWRVILFRRAEQLGKRYDYNWPYTYPFLYIMRYEKDKRGAELW